MKRSWWLTPVLLLPWAIVGLDVGAQPITPNKAAKISWKKIVLDKNFRSEGVAVADVNKDGKPDVIVGDCWYEAPKDPAGEWKRHILRVDRVFDPHNYSDAFACFADDFNSDGYPDVIVIPFPGNPCYWYENPGAAGGKWIPHLLTNSACNETPIYVDLFKTGKKILVMGWNPPKDENDLKKGNYDDRGEICCFLPGKDPAKPWQRVSVSGPSAKGKTIPGTARFSHGLGHGDLNGDGRPDVLTTEGWWEQPEKIDGAPWKFHATRITDACADMHVLDVDGDGKADVLSSSAHNYGMWWSQQKALNAFIQRPLFPNPAEVARLSAAAVKMTPEEKTLYDTINRLRDTEFRRAPFAANAELCQIAREEAENKAKNGGIAATSRRYPGKILAIKSMRFAPAADSKSDAKQGKDQKTPLQLFALSLLPDNDKDKNLLLPGFEIGIGAAKTESGAIQYTLVIGDRGQFSLPSQTHALNFVDIDGDGSKDLVTGRRWWAHGPRGDAGPGDPAYLYWFQAQRGKDGLITFIPHMIDDDSGIGTQFAIADINGDGIPDVIVSNKHGVFVFLQMRKE